MLVSHGIPKMHLCELANKSLGDPCKQWIDLLVAAYKVRLAAFLGKWVLAVVGHPPRKRLPLAASGVFPNHVLHNFCMNLAEHFFFHEEARSCTCFWGRMPGIYLELFSGDGCSATMSNCELGPNSEGLQPGSQLCVPFQREGVEFLLSVFWIPSPSLVATWCGRRVGQQWSTFPLGVLSSLPAASALRADLERGFTMCLWKRGRWEGVGFQLWLHNPWNTIDEMRTADAWLRAHVKN